KLSGIDFQAVPGFGLQVDIGLLEVFPGVGVPIGGVNRVHRLSEAYIQVESKRSGRAVDGDLADVDVRRVGAEVEVLQAVESGGWVVVVPVNVAIEQKAEICAPLRQGRLRCGRRRRRGGRGVLWRCGGGGRRGSFLTKRQ